MNMVVKAAQPFFKDEYKKDIIGDFDGILSSGRFIFGPFTSRFEQAFAKYHRKRHAIAVHSCSAALEITMRYIGIRGFEVIVPTNTFVATAFSVLRAGGKLVLCDIEPDYCGLSVPSLKKRITRKTKAVIAVHIGGYIVPWMSEIRDFCRERSLILIEDCAHAHGATLDNKLAGTFGLTGCFSFYPTKVMTSGVGGCVLTDDEKLAGFVRSLRHFGEGKDLGDVRHEGSNWIMDEFRAVLAYYQLLQLPENIKKRRKIARFYTKEIKGINGINIVKVGSSQEPAYYRFLAFLDKGRNKSHFLKDLRERYGIESGTLYDPPVHRQPYFSRELNFKTKNFPVAEETLSRQIAFPVHPGLSREDIIYIKKAVEQILE